ncbi:MAG TPA: ATP-binding protein [Thermoanaerobaculia bacterium]|nr:ATP-binding protein [Thermoanaerobaculia bacterium]
MRSAPSRRLLIGAVVFGLFVLCDIALFGWLIFRSLSEREVDRVLLETREEAETLAQQIARRAEKQGRDLYTAVAVERETQTYIDNVLRERAIVQQVVIRDKNGMLVFQGNSEAHVPVGPSGPPSVGSSELPSPPVEEKVQESTSTYEVPEVKVPIGDYGMLQIGISPVELEKRIEVLRGDLVRQTVVIGIVTLLLFVAAYVVIWWLLGRARRLEQQATEAERMAYIGTLASGLAHEIRNPLNSLSLNMQMLEEEIEEHGSAPTGKRLLSITRSELSRLERLATDFLAYAKPRPLEMEEVPAVWLLERTREVLAADIRRRGAQVEIEDRSGGARVRVDPGQLNQLLLNLMQNALAATEESGRPPVVRLTAYRRGSSVALELADNGIGIPPEEQDKIFDLFYSTRKGGTGLGLAIVDRIARTHGGQVEVRSTAGSGTTMTVEIPAAGAPEAASQPALESSARA